MSNVALVLDSVPEQFQDMLLAIMVIENRLKTLPKEDSEAIYELIRETARAETDSDRRAIRRAILEILDQQPLRTVPLSPHDGDAALGLRKWSEGVGRKVREQRDSKGWTQALLAEKAGLPQPHVSRIETGEISPTHKTLVKIAAALEIPVTLFDPCFEDC
ncbi:MAG: helix-turn-helix domain-containing protein [Gemmataceae bacterium]